jgi:hypothetical protein
MIWECDVFFAIADASVGQIGETDGPISTIVALLRTDPETQCSAAEVLTYLCFNSGKRAHVCVGFVVCVQQRT